MEAIRLGLPTVALVLAYLVGINVLGARLGRGQKDARDYFLGNHAMPWGAVLRLDRRDRDVGADVSLGAGRRLHERLHVPAARLRLRRRPVRRRGVASSGLFPQGDPHGLRAARGAIRAAGAPHHVLLFMGTRVLAAAVRLAVPAIPIAILLRIPVWTAILALAAGTALYTLARRNQGRHLDRPDPGLSLSVRSGRGARPSARPGARRAFGRVRRPRRRGKSRPPLRLRSRPRAALHVLVRASRRRVSHDGEPRRRSADRAAAARLPRPARRAEGARRERLRRARPDGALHDDRRAALRALRGPPASTLPTRSSRLSSSATCRRCSRPTSSRGSSRRRCAPSPRP